MYNIYQKLSPKEEAELASGIKAIKEGRSLLDSNGGKRNRKQRGGGKEEIVASLEQCHTCQLCLAAPLPV